MSNSRRKIPINYKLSPRQIFNDLLKVLDIERFDSANVEFLDHLASMLSVTYQIRNNRCHSYEWISRNRALDQKIQLCLYSPPQLLSLSAAQLRLPYIESKYYSLHLVQGAHILFLLSRSLRAWTAEPPVFNTNLEAVIPFTRGSIDQKICFQEINLQHASRATHNYTILSRANMRRSFPSDSVLICDGTNTKAFAEFVQHTWRFPAPDNIFHDARNQQDRIADIFVAALQHLCASAQVSAKQSLDERFHSSHGLT